MLTVAAGVAAAATVFGSGAWSAASAASLTISAQGAAGTSVTGSSQFRVSGDTTVSIRVARLSGGTAHIVNGPDSTLTRAVQFPAYVSSGTYPRAVLGVTPTQGLALSPGSGNFQFGAVFRLDSASSGRTDDNGDNIFQRGLSSESSLFKLEVDHGRPACTVRGGSGTVITRSSTVVSRNTWYRTTCTRVGRQVTVSVVPYGAGKTAISNAASGSMGSLSWPSTRPASIGGKLTDSGAIAASASDQFNGAIAQVSIHAL